MPGFACGFSYLVRLIEESVLIILTAPEHPFQRADSEYAKVWGPQMIALFVYSKKIIKKIPAKFSKLPSEKSKIFFFLACLKPPANPETRQPRTKAAICTCARWKSLSVLGRSVQLFWDLTFLTDKCKVQLWPCIHFSFEIICDFVGHLGKVLSTPLCKFNIVAFPNELEHLKADLTVYDLLLFPSSL